MELLGSKPVRDAYRGTSAVMGYAHHQLRKEKREGVKLNEVYKTASRRYQRLLDMLRLDLGIDPDDPKVEESYRRARAQSVTKEAP